MKYILAYTCMIASLNGYSQSAAHMLVDASIRYHDPENQWQELRAIMGFTDTRPGQPDRRASFFINNPDGIFCITREQEDVNVTRHIVGDEISYDVNGKASFSEEEISKYTLTPDRSLMLRDYYLYLWGMPMKLKDPGTNLDPEVYTKTFNGQITAAIRVTYDATVGTDIWYFYFSPKNNELVGYQFYHDEEKGDGEYILLKNAMTLNGLSIPKNRTWYTNQDSTILGTDQLVHLAKAHLHH